MKKAFDQTVRDIKREVNKKVLKVPGIEQKVLDATSNEPWGPHGTLLADIAQASRNYHEYQMIMGVIWKRINDTGKNWRHVYKALTVLEYLVAHGSERVIDEIREHAYQISTLSDFQYIDSSGRDQGNNVRRKSQSLVMLVNDKERITEVRQKAAANRDKFRSVSSSGGMYRPSGAGDRYDDDRYEGRYGSRDEYGYGRERDWGSKDEDRYSRNGDSYSRDGDRYSRDYEERYGRDSYRDDDYRGRSRSIDDYHGSSRSRSHDRERDRSVDDDGQYSSRGSAGRADDNSQDERRLDRKYSEQNIGAPPSYEEVVGDSRSPVHSERDVETSATSAPKPSSPPVTDNTSPPANAPGSSASPAKQEFETFDEFDPRGPLSAAPTTSKSAETDLLGSLSDSFSANPLAIMPVTSGTSAPEADAVANTDFGPTFAAAPPSASNVMNQSFEDPFGDSPFKATLSGDSTLVQPPTATPVATMQPNVNQNAEMPQMGGSRAETTVNYDFGDSLSGLTYAPASAQNSQFYSEPNPNTDILADILPPSGPSVVSAPQAPFSAPSGHPAQLQASMYGNFGSQSGPMAPVASQVPPHMQTGLVPQFNYGNFPQHMGTSAPNGNVYPQAGAAPPPPPHMAPQNMSPAHTTSGSFLPSVGTSTVTSHMPPQQALFGGAVQQNNDVLGNLLPQTGQNSLVASQPPLSSSTGALAIVPQPSKDKKFETKSTVWADTLSRGLVNLNISGPKTNPLADIGVDFDAINRKEKRMEKQSAAPVTSTINMGKAMGSGSGMGRAGASALRPPPNPVAGSGMGMGMGMGMGGGQGSGMGMNQPMGGYGGMNQPMGMGMGMNNMGMGMNAGYNMGMGMNMGVGQGAPMQRPTGLPPGSSMPAGYNPMMGGNPYAQQQYGGGYR